MNLYLVNIKFMRKLIFSLGQLARKLKIGPQSDEHPAVLAMMRKIQKLGSIEFKIEFHSDGNWTAESTNIDGIITGGKDTREVKAMIKDAIFTYFRIPPYFVHDSLLRANNEPVIVQQKVWVTR